MAMKISVDVATLTRELSRFQGILPSKSSMPASLFILLEAKESGVLKLSATDLDLSLISEIPCEVSRAGSIALQGKAFFEAIRPLRSDMVTLEAEANQYVQLTSGRTRARLIGLDAMEFPTLQGSDVTTLMTIPTLKLLFMVERILPSVCADDGRPTLQGGLLQVQESGKVSLTATDGHRLARAETLLYGELPELPATFEKGIIVPRKGLDQLRRIIDTSEENVTVGMEGNTLHLSWGSSRFTIRLIDGSFPRTDQVIVSPRPDRQALLPRKEFLDRLNYARLFCSARTGNVRLAFETDLCTITAQDPDRGEVEEVVAVTYGGEDVHAGFNVKYLIDVLQVVSGEDVSLELSESLAPAVLRETEGEEGDEAVFVIMPMRL